MGILTLRLNSLTARPGRLSGFAAVLDAVAQGGWGDAGSKGALAEGGGVRGAGHQVMASSATMASFLRS